jgi:hypothetical protein
MLLQKLGVGNTLHSVGEIYGVVESSISISEKILQIDESSFICTSLK